MKKIILSALAVVAMASCSRDNDVAVMPNNGEVRISSSIATRTTGNNWDDGDAIGVYMTTNGGTFADLGENVKYTTATTSGNFSSDSPLYFPATDNVDLMAYYPYSDVDGFGATAYGVNVTTQTDQGAIDLMKAEVTDVKKNPIAVNMIFRHKLARIKLNISNGDGVSVDDLNNLVVTLKGTDSKAIYDLTKADDATPIILGGAVADITMLTTEAGTSAEAIVIPQILNGASLTFTTSDNTYSVDIKTSEFTIGNEYVYNVKVSNTAVIISSPTIDPWGEGNSSEGEDLEALLPVPNQL